MSSPSLVWPVVGLVFAAWAVSLGGLAALQEDCSASSGASYLGVRGFNAGILSCSKIYRYYWFIVAFEFVIVAGLAASVAAGLLRKARLSWLGLFAVATLLYIQSTDSFLTAESVGPFKHGQLQDRARATTAGFMATAVANAIAVIVLGFECEDAAAPKTDPVHASAV